MVRPSTQTLGEGLKADDSDIIGKEEELLLLLTIVGVLRPMTSSRTVARSYTQGRESFHVIAQPHFHDPDSINIRQSLTRRQHNYVPGPDNCTLSSHDYESSRHNYAISRIHHDINLSTPMFF